MATLILSAVGTAIGGPLGGALGALIGRQVDSTVIGPRSANGPRLKELAVQTSSYGSAIPVHFGTIRAAGSVIWSTELIEHQERSGGGKGRPSLTSYTYTASFAVAICSRPIAGIGRIWADGSLLRGARGDLKVAGAMRIYRGFGDQEPDPLLAQAEGIALNPAYRNTAYVVFEDLALADYGNRLPSLTFEILADENAPSFADVCKHLLGGSGVDAEALEELIIPGLSVDQGTVGDTLAVLAEIAPVSCAVRGDRLLLNLSEPSAGAGLPLPVLPLPCAGGDSAEDARQSGWSRRRDALPSSQQCAVRYYDVSRDYQPGLQRSAGRNAPGDVSTIELPAAMTATQARGVAERAARRRTRPRETMRYRITEIDPQLSPGACVHAPGVDGVWRIEQWEWQADGIMLDLVAVPSMAAPASTADAGRANQPTDLLSAPTRIVAAEMPWNGANESNLAELRVAATAASDGWTGAALYAQTAGGIMQPLGSSGRRRAIAGSALTGLSPASPLLFDTRSTVDVELAADDLTLDDANWSQLAQGANLALLGAELLQFGRAERLSPRVWQLSALLRGRGGTEHSVGEHEAGEPFVLLDDRAAAIDSSLILNSSTTEIVALGLGDIEPSRSPIINPGLTLRPLSPVHGKASASAGGALRLDWVRRARGAWTWQDLVEVPLNEAEELWEIETHLPDGTAQIWRTSTPSITIPASQLSDLMAGGSPPTFAIRQVGRQSKSLPLAIPVPR